METAKVEILASLTEYKRLLIPVCEDIFNINDDMAINIFHKAFIEEIFNRSLDVSYKLLVELNLETLIKRFEDRLYLESNKYKLTLNTEVVENKLGYIILLLTDKIGQDLGFKINQIQKICSKFHNFPMVRLINSYDAILEYIVKVEK